MTPPGSQSATNISHSFTGQSVIITGAARGVGLAVADYFARSAARVYLVDFDEREVVAAAASIGGIPMRADVSSTEDVERVVADVIADSGRVDILVNNAGILRDAMMWKLTDDDWDQVLDVHLGGTFRFTRACIPHFRAQNFGRVINVTSASGMHGNIGQANYAAAKGGIIALTKTAAKELAGFGVTVNAISPNANTRMIEAIPDKVRDQITNTIPLRRFAEPAEMAPAIAYLASKEASYVTGVVLPVDGGISM